LAGIFTTYFMPSQKTEEQLRTVIDAVIDDYDATDVDWNWGEAVLMAGIIRASAHLDDERYLEFVKDWADHHRTQLSDHLSITSFEINRWAPAFPCLMLGDRTGDYRYLEMAAHVIDYMFANGPRLQNGAFGHGSGDLERQAWVDTVWHTTPLLSHASRILDNPEYQTEAVRQLNAFSAHAQNPHTGLFNHLYDEQNDRVNGIYWARGNGWMAMAYPEVLRNADENNWSTRGLIEQYGRLLQGLQVHQDGGGLWHTVVDDPDTYIETSGSAMMLFSYAIVERDDLFSMPTIDLDRTWNALVDQIEDGKVTGVSGGTGPGSDVSHYAERPVGVYHWGTGAFLLAGSVYSDLV
jgi:unsaturated rhamnogalacturonyl hydrolase